MSGETNGQLTLREAIKLTTDLLRAEKKPKKMAELVGPEPPPFPNQSDCEVLYEMIQAAKELYYGNCIL